MLEVPQEAVTLEDLPFGAVAPEGMPKSAAIEFLYQSIPSRLGEMEPGPVLAALLSSIDVTEVSGHDQVVVLRAHQRLVSFHTAGMYHDIAALNTTMKTYDGYPLPNEDAVEMTAAEVRAALHLTRRAADIEVAFALDLDERLPRLVSMLDAGVIDLRRARTIERGTVHLSDTAAQAVLDQIADAAPELTTGELGARIRRLCIEVDPGDAARRYETAHEGRRIVMEPTSDATVNLMGYDLPPDQVTVIMSKVNAIAKHLHGIQDETRTMDQLRADICMDLLSGSTLADSRSSQSGVVELLVDLETLAGLDNNPGDLGGYGPVIADVARQIADNSPDAQSRITGRHPTTGEPIHLGTTSRRPTPAQRRRIETSHRTCVFPGCRMPAMVCDLDHITAVHDGGPTCDCNLAPLCRFDHRIKHEKGWRYEQQPNGQYQWTTPLGHTYTNTPP